MFSLVQMLYLIILLGILKPPFVRQFVTLLAQGYTVINVKPECRKPGKRFDMMCIQFAANNAAILTSVIVTPENF
jgi:hypothetical protein